MKKTGFLHLILKSIESGSLFSEVSDHEIDIRYLSYLTLGRCNIYKTPCIFESLELCGRGRVTIIILLLTQHATKHQQFMH